VSAVGTSGQMYEPPLLGTGAVPGGNGVVTLIRCNAPLDGRWKAAISGMPKLQNAE
jgi:hypothetical protein